MIGIVIVSHSAPLAAGVKELASQMTQGKVPLAVAGGVDDPENPIGTDPMRVLSAIEEVYSDAGVVVFMDLGSALMSAEMALEFLSPEMAANVYLCSAPLVEGVMAGAVQASVGATAVQVMQEATASIRTKQSQIENEHLDTPQTNRQTDTPAAAADHPDASNTTLTIHNPQGLHARPAANLVRLANQYTADVTVRKGTQFANAKSINQIATLGVVQGDEIVVTALGSDADAAIQAIEALAAENFGEEIKETSPAGPNGRGQTAAIGTAVDGVLQGIPAAPGVALGRVVQYRPQLPTVETYNLEPSDVSGEVVRLQEAIAQAVAELQAVERRTSQQIGSQEAAIFGAHQLILQDPDLQKAALRRIQDDRLNSEAAWLVAANDLAAQYAALEDEYMRGRAADVRDVAQRVLRFLMDVQPASLDLTEPAILLANDLTPSDTTRLDPNKVLAICTELGGATSHSAILARALGIPAVVGLGALLGRVPEGKQIALDGETGQLWLELSAEEEERLQNKRSAWLAEQKEAKQAGQRMALTADGVRLEVSANIAHPQDVAKALEYGAEGVGLFRTEFLFMDRTQPPSEEEQYEAYRQAAEALGDRPLIIRTLDIGGDKPLAYLELGEEENPFLGYRAIRFCLERPEIFKPQLRAILRASAHGRVHIMFPMIGTLDELRAAKAQLLEAKSELKKEGLAFDNQLPVGIMVEVPSAVAIADQLAREVDFFSIGTNDLTQYTMAADRGNVNVAGLVNALQPAVLRLVQQTAKAAQTANIWTGMCGELAGNALAAPLLVGLGVRELSMAAPAIPAVKAALSQMTVAEAEALARAVLQLGSATAV
ncbi:MAG: phosphoenolpyruvate--protein phosphotransferase, partial [Anaerolineales bacterium]|nr:phosphoenolpyruvate--protein phosphotransferase [Anaerolineales bacterium]